MRYLFGLVCIALVAALVVIFLDHRPAGNASAPGSTAPTPHAAVHHGKFPIAAWYRIPVRGTGYLYTLRNVTDVAQRMKAIAFDKTVEAVIDPGDSYELTRNQGFVFAAGDVLTVTVAGDSKQFSIPDKAPPLIIWYHEAFFGKTQVLVVHRNQESITSVKVVCDRPATGEKKIFTNASWGSSNNYEIGRGDGWTFAAGDTISISADGIDTLLTIFE